MGCHAFETAGGVWLGSFSIRDERRSNRFHPGHRYLSPQRVSPQCGSLPDASGKPQLLGAGPVPLDGLRADDFSGEFARHRSVPERMPSSLRDGIAGQCHAHQFGLRQRTPRLARPCRFGASVDSPSASSLRRRHSRAGHRRDGLRLGCLHHRPLSGNVPLGAFPANQGGNQTAYNDRPEWFDSCIHPHHGRGASTT